MVRLIVLTCLVCSCLWAAGPPPALPPGVGTLIEQLGSDNHAIRRKARERLEALDDDAIPLLQRAAAGPLEVDVRLALYAAVGSIRDRAWGPVKAMGPGAALTVPPPFGGYWFNRIRFSRDGRHAIVGGGALIRYDLATGKEEVRLMEVGGARPGLDVARDGKHVLTGHAGDRNFHLTELPSLKTVTTFTGHTAGVCWVALSPDGTLAASVSNDITARIWDAKTGKELRRCADYRRNSSWVTFSPDGRELLVASDGDPGMPTLWFFDPVTGKLLRSFTCHSTRITSAVYHPDGKTLLTSSSNGALLRLRLADGKELMRLSHGAGIHELALAPDGRRVLTAGGDRVIKAWDIETQQLRETLHGHMGGVLSVAFSPDGRQALTCDTVATVRLWKIGR